MSNAIDWPLAVKTLRGNTKIAREILAMFVEELPNAQENIQMALAQRNFTLLYEYLHKLQGGCSYCGVVELKKAVEEFSNAVKTPKPDADYAELMKKLNYHCKAVLDDYHPETYTDTEISL